MSSWSLQKLYFNLSSGVKPVVPLPKVRFNFALIRPTGVGGPFWLLLEPEAEKSRAFQAACKSEKEQEVTDRLYSRGALGLLGKSVRGALGESAQEVSLWLLISQEPVDDAQPPVEGRKLPEMPFLRPMVQQLEREQQRRKFLEMAETLRERQEWVMELLGRDRYSSSLVSERFLETMVSSLAWGLTEDLWQTQQRSEPVVASPVSPSKPRVNWAERLRLDILEVHVGRGLLDLVDPQHGSPLLARVEAIRSQVLARLGIIVPGIRFRDDLALGENDYTISLRGQRVATGQLRCGLGLSIGPAHKLEQVVQATKGASMSPDSVFALPSCWTDQRELSEQLGCMLFSPAEVLGCHLFEVVAQHASEIFDFDEFEGMMELHRANHPRLHRELDNRQVDRVRIWRVLGELLSERVSIRDLSRILQTIMLSEGLAHEPLVEACRRALWRELTRSHADCGTDIEVVALSELQEAMLLSKDAEQMVELGKHLIGLFQLPTDRGRGLVFLCAPETRRPLRDLLRPSLPRASFLSTEEVDVDQLLEVVQFSPDASTCQVEPDSEPVGWKSRWARVGAFLRQWWGSTEAA